MMGPPDDDASETGRGSPSGGATSCGELGWVLDWSAAFLRPR